MKLQVAEEKVATCNASFLISVLVGWFLIFSVGLHSSASVYNFLQKKGISSLISQAQLQSLHVLQFGQCDYIPCEDQQSSENIWCFCSPSGAIKPLALSPGSSSFFRHPSYSMNKLASLAISFSVNALFSKQESIFSIEASDSLAHSCSTLLASLESF